MTEVEALIAEHTEDIYAELEKQAERFFAYDEPLDRRKPLDNISDVLSTFPTGAPSLDPDAYPELSRLLAGWSEIEAEIDEQIEKIDAEIDADLENEA